jgi:hypothetical protein
LGAGDHFGGGRHVPDINAQADDWRFLGQNGFNDFERALLKIELDNTGLRAQRTYWPANSAIQTPRGCTGH